MAQSTKSTIEVTIARALGVVFAGVLVGLAAGAVAHHFNFPLDLRIQYLAGITAGALCWLATSRLVGFAEDTMSIPTVAADAGFRKRPAGSLAAAGAQALAGRDRESSSVSQIETDAQDDGKIKVTLTVDGLSKREFNVLRARAENVPGTRWSDPVNLGERKRKLEGVVHCGNAQQQAVRKLEELTGKRV